MFKINHLLASLNLLEKAHLERGWINPLEVANTVTPPRRFTNNDNPRTRWRLNNKMLSERFP